MADSSPSSSPVELNPSEAKSALMPLRTPILQVTPNGLIKWANRQALIDYGYGGTNDNLAGKSINDLTTPPQTPEDLKALFQMTLKANVQFKLGTPVEKIKLPKVEIINARGRRRVIQYRPTLIESETDGINEKVFQIEATDITQQKQTEALNAANRLIHQHELSLDKILDGVQSALKSVIPYDTANIMMVGEDGFRITYKWGYDENGPQPLVKSAAQVDLSDRPLLRKIADTQEPHYVSDVSDPASEYSFSSKGSHNGSWCGAPLIVNGKVLGFLNLNSNTQGTYIQEDADLLGKFAQTVSTAIEHALEHEERRKQSLTDPLTDLPNRRRFNEQLRIEMERAIRGKHQLCLIICDIDRFSDFNDFANHQAGDEVFKQFAAVLKKSTRDIDTPARGGEGADEFTIILPETDKTIALVIAQRIQQELKNLPGVKVLKSGRSTKHQRNITEDETLMIGSSIGIALLDEIRNYEKESGIESITDPVQRNTAYKNLYMDYQIKFYELADTRLMKAKAQKGIIVTTGDEPANSNPPSPSPQG